ncbi:phospholipase D nuclease [Lecanosticta acicola]|uniref:Phospholipase D nuclease n=1 Tax=Lecanosticta acicola TaxID=111012 RepID=A0AAI8Z334_9PEZI|nr:phospholipase D nuclease [Lecanosticta acicola]
MGRDKIEQYCDSTLTISSEYAKDSSRSIGEIAEELYGSNHLSTVVTRKPDQRGTSSQNDLQWARNRGQFGDTQPSELFLHAFHDLLQCVERDAMSNCVSPPLIGTTGSAPMTIIAPLNDQLRHMSNLIARAKKEVLLATNFWKASGASTFVTDALVELSKRAGERGEKVVVRLMYDRGALKQFLDNHQNVSPKEWQAAAVGLPAPEKIPNLDLAVVNFHRPPLGTFHSKFMIVDRSIATVSSNNIQDNDNVEMMAHLEGPIVDSLWETFLVSWHNHTDPPLPYRDLPAAKSVPPTYEEESYKALFESDGSFRLPERKVEMDMPEHMPNEPHYDETLASEIQRMRCTLNPRSGENHNDAVARHLNKPTSLSLKASAPERSEQLNFFPFIPVPNRQAVPMAMCSRKPYANLNNESVFVPQNEAFLSLIRNATRTIFIQTPDLNAKPLLPALISACKRGIEVTYYVCLGYNDGGELLPGQGGTNEMAANHLYSQLEADEKKNLKVFFYVAADQDRPIHNSFKQRSCHIKLLIADESVAIQGSGNQDTQSWFHSQEVNVMIDSPVVCKAWREGIERNQNTAIYGRAKEDGCWYDPKTGKLAEGSYGHDAGKFSAFKGFSGILKKAEGK